MPKISEFYGLLIYMYFSDHAPPHFHVLYNEFEALIEIIERPRVITGFLPTRAKKMAIEWAQLHLQELKRNWENASHNKKLSKIAPLD
jgi:hypothetical protein